MAAAVESGQRCALSRPKNLCRSVQVLSSHLMQTADCLNWTFLRLELATTFLACLLHISVAHHPQELFQTVAQKRRAPYLPILFYLSSVT